MLIILSSSIIPNSRPSINCHLPRYTINIFIIPNLLFFCSVALSRLYLPFCRLAFFCSGKIFVPSFPCPLLVFRCLNYWIPKFLIFLSFPSLSASPLSLPHSFFPSSPLSLPNSFSPSSLLPFLIASLLPLPLFSFPFPSLPFFTSSYLHSLSPFLLLLSVP